MAALGAVVVAAMLFCNSCYAARILGLFPVRGRSHMTVNSALVQELATRGHHVTVVSYFPQKPPFPNVTDIAISNWTYEDYKPPINFFNLAGIPPLMSGVMLWAMGPSSTDEALAQPEVKKLIESKDKQFDLIIMEAFFNEAFLGFAHKYKAPVVQICAFGGTNWMGDWFGNPHPYSYVPDNFLSYSDKMDLWQRLVNTLVGTYFRLGRSLYYLPRQDSVMRKHFENTVGPMPYLSEIETYNRLLLVNNHFSLNFPRPFMPNIVQVGGLHIRAPKKLPQDLQKYIDEAPEGVIYFSMGSNLQSSQMPESKRRAFLEAFSKLKQKVLWKWETDTLPGQPSNVKLGKWLPQSDILAHPNLRLFITHGGVLSTQEAVHRGVPIVAVPIFGDQKVNSLKAEAAGFGVILDYFSVTEEIITSTIQEALNPKYRENAQRISRIFRDQPLTPLEQAVFWTEYVIRHKGAPHMRSAALDLSWYQYSLLDVIAVLALAAGSVLLVIYCVLSRLFKRCCGRSTEDEVQKNETIRKKRR